jgi:hypothetical protein
MGTVPLAIAPMASAACKATWPALRFISVNFSGSPSAGGRGSLSGWSFIVLPFPSASLAARRAAMFVRLPDDLGPE